jgi:NAD(P)-dependent dehydrogenase (short-subunit alcohol dehydrogenase family)
MSFTIDPSLLGLEDAVALVTGGGRGIGKSSCVLLARAGCHVAVADINADTAQQTVAEIEELGLGRKAIAIQADALDEQAVRDMIQETVLTLGQLDVACNVVGNPAHQAKPILDLSLDEWNSSVHRNLGSTFIATRSEALAMIEGHRPGRIVTVSSSSGYTGAPNISDYGAANAGIIHFTKSAAMELAPFGIRVNCIVPGTHEKDPKLSANAALPGRARFRELATKAPPMKRLGRTEETAGLAVFLASNLSSYMTGHALFSEGGLLHTTARPPAGMIMMPAAVAHIEWAAALPIFRSDEAAPQSTD